MNNMFRAIMMFSLIIFFPSCVKQEVKAPEASRDEILKTLEGLKGALVKDYALGLPEKEFLDHINNYSIYYRPNINDLQLSCDILFPYSHSNSPASKKLGEQNFHKYNIPNHETERSKYSMYMRLNPGGQRFKSLKDFDKDLAERTRSAIEEITKVADLYNIDFNLDRLKNRLMIYGGGGNNCSTFLHSDSDRTNVGTKRYCKYLPVSLSDKKVKVIKFGGSGLSNDKVYFHNDKFLYAYIEVENIDINHLHRVLRERFKDYDLGYDANFNLIASARVDPVRESKYVEVYSRHLLSMRDTFSSRCSEVSFAHLLGQLSEQERVEESKKRSIIEAQVKASGI